MRTFVVLGLVGALLGLGGGLVAHFTSYTVRSGYYFAPLDDRSFLIRPPWTDLLPWIGSGLVLGVLAAVLMWLAGLRFVRDRRR